MAACCITSWTAHQLFIHQTSTKADSSHRQRTQGNCHSPASSWFHKPGLCCKMRQRIKGQITGILEPTNNYQLFPMLLHGVRYFENDCSIHIRPELH